MTLNLSSEVGNTSDETPGLSIDDDATIPTHGLVSFRILISTVYFLVSVVGLLGNFFVMYLIGAKKVTSLTAIDIFVFCLALSDLQFALTLPFWAVDAILDFSWPFGHPMCKIILTITVLNVYYNVFLLTAMAVTRYWSVALALSLRCRVSTYAAKWISFALWLLALGATIPTTIFASTNQILGDDLCLLKFPGNKWLATYHLQRVIIAFVIPLVVISSSYIMLLNFLRQHRVNCTNQHRQNKITNSIQLVIIVFFVCWFPNHAGTFWGILLKYEVVQWSEAYYYFHTYVYPFTVCLAHSNSCLNPIIYCLIRKEFRKSLKALFWQVMSIAASHLPTGNDKQANHDQETSMPLCRKSSFPQTDSKNYPAASMSTITLFPEVTIKDQHEGQETSLD